MRLALRVLVGVLAVVLLVACGQQETETPAAPEAGEAQTPETEAPVAETPAGEAAEAEAEENSTPEEQPAEAAEEEAEDDEIGFSDIQSTDFSVSLELVAEGFIQPVNLTHAGDGSGRLFVVDQVGQIYIISADAEVLDEPFLDIADRLVEINTEYSERGLLGLAFHPDYANNGRFFVYYSAPLRDEAPEGWNHTTHLSEFTVSDDPDRADPDSERIIMQYDQPQVNHNAGQIRFGPDGYLYVPLGDGGGADDNGEGHVDDWYEENEGGNGQDVSEKLLGSILRIDIDSGDPYAIPEDNPVLGDNAGPDEQWAFGFRNPYSMHFDSGGDNWLLVADAGQNIWEEVSVVEAGGNYGWNVYEGTHCFSTDDPDAEDAGPCPEEDPWGNTLRIPVIEYRNINHPFGLGLVIIGGTIYRGERVPDLQGMYVFGDWSTSRETADGQLFVAEVGEPDDGLWPVLALSTSDDTMGRLEGEAILAFGVDEDDEIYILTTRSTGPSAPDGSVYRIGSAD